LQEVRDNCQHVTTLVETQLTVTAPGTQK